VKKRNTIFLAFMLLFFTGCGGGGSGTTAYVASSIPCTLPDIDKNNLPPLPAASDFSANPLYRQQWAIHYDQNFYGQYRIFDDASIHMDGDQRFIGRSVKVAVIDDALDIYHEDLQGTIVQTYDVSTNSSDVLPSDGTQNHGMEVSGVIAARDNSLGLVGVAPEVELYFIKMPFSNTVSISEIVEAFAKAKEWGVDVVNCSWGSGDVSETVKAAIVDLARNGRGGKGTVIVFAAGNGGDDAVGDPIGNDESSIPEVIAVGATNIYNQRTEYSNYGPELDLMAPGGERLGITTTDRTGVEGDDPGNYVEYNSSSAFRGTSAAAPIVTGVAARLLEANPNLSRTDVMSVLKCSADKIDASGCGYDQNGFSQFCGYGKVNVNAALSLVR